MKRLLVLCGLALCTLLFLPASAPALTFTLDTHFSGDAPVSSPPWMRIDVTNISGGVHVDLVNLLTSGFAGEVFLNVNPALNPTLFTYNALNSVAAASTISVGTNAFKADGDGYFDILFSFPTAAGPDRFTGGETASYSILYTGLTDSDFAFLSAPDGAGQGLFFAAAHIQGGGAEGGSSWVGAEEFSEGQIPEPATLILLGSGMLGLWRVRKQR